MREYPAHARGSCFGCRQESISAPCAGRTTVRGISDERPAGLSPSFKDGNPPPVSINMHCMKSRPQEDALLPGGFSVRCPQRMSISGTAAAVAELRTTVVPDARA